MGNAALICANSPQAKGRVERSNGTRGVGLEGAGLAHRNNGHSGSRERVLGHLLGKSQ